jgi:hypothetical protein
MVTLEGPDEMPPVATSLDVAMDDATDVDAAVESVASSSWMRHSMRSSLASLLRCWSAHG